MTFDEMWADLKSKYPKICITAEQLSDAMKDLDAVCVVRCKDCVHFAHDGMAIIQDTGYYCTRPNQQSCNLIPEDYCSYGKRKESDVYCDRNLCAQNEYNGIGCNECQQMRKGEVEE